MGWQTSSGETTEVVLALDFWDDPPPPITGQQLGNLLLSLHAAHPGTIGSLPENEVSYRGYQRQVLSLSRKQHPDGTFRNPYNTEFPMCHGLFPVEVNYIGFLFPADGTLVDFRKLDGPIVVAQGVTIYFPPEALIFNPDRLRQMLRL